MSALEDILRQHPVWRGGAMAPRAEAFSTGYESLDREIGGGWPGGTLTEILGSLEGIGELQLVLPALARLSMNGRKVVWIAPPHLPYPPALAAAGVDLAQLAVIRAPGRRDTLWAAEQVLRAGASGALLVWLKNARYAELRRLAVAAEGSRAFVALFRSAAAMGEASPAGLRLALQPAREGLDLHILKRRGASAATPLRVPAKRPFHALGRASLPASTPGEPRADRRLGLPVHS